LGRRAALAIWLLCLAAVAADARAAVQQCVAGGTIAAPLDFAAPSTWNPPGVPDATSDLVLSQPCAVRCNAGTCTARTLKGTNPTGSIEVAPGATLALAGCDTASAYQQSTYECGGEAGFRFAPQGAIVHDSTADGDPILRGSSLPAQPNRLRFALASAIGAQPGDWFQVRSGPTRSQVHRVAAVDYAGCPGNPAACWLEVELHDPNMEFGQNAHTAGYGTGVGYFGPGTVRIAASDQPGYASNRLDHCVEVCTSRSGGSCTASTAITRDYSYVGWYLGASDAALDPASPSVMSRRMMIVDSRNGVTETIGGVGNVDRVCFADPIPPEWVPATGWVDRPAVVWPGFWPGDAWVVFRPATVRYAGAEGDGGLGFHGACIDSDFAFFDGWAKLATRDGTPSCQQPYQDTVITSWAHGIAGQPMNQQSACNGHSVDLLGYDALSGDRVAIVDTRTDVNLSGICYAGADPATDSGFHGIAMADTVFDAVAPPAEWLIRYAGDDGIFIGSSGLGPITYRMPRWTWWWNETGTSTEAVDFLASDPGQTVRLEDARVVMYASSLPCKGALDDPTNNVRYEVDGMLFVEPGHPGRALGLGAPGGHDVTDFLGFGDATGACSAFRSARVRSSWLSGWNRLIDLEVREVDGVYLASGGTTASGPVFGSVPQGESVSIHDFVLDGLPGAALVSASCGSGCDLAVRDGYAAWKAPFTNGLANFYTSSRVHLVAPLEGLLFSNSRLLTCNLGWGETGIHIGRNLLHAAPGGIPINVPTACPLAAPQKLVATTGFAPAAPFRADLSGEQFGPQARVGLGEGATIAIEADLTAGYAIPAAPCANGVDDDWDGETDGDDVGCSDAVDASERTAAWACDNGLDDDLDGKSDAGFDPGCPNPMAAPENPKCDNGLDDDLDGFIDFADPHCNPLHPYAERPSNCGVGFEIAFALAALKLRARASAGRRGPRTS
jgi:hypothetical protein